MAQFYREQDKPAVYTGYDPTTGKFSGEIGSEARAQQLGVIPDWEASWKPAGATTNIQTITPESLKNTTAYDLTGAPTASSVDNSGVLAASATAQAEADAKVAQEKAKQTTAESDITTLLKQLEQQPAEKLQAEQTAGIPEFKLEQADIQGQIAVKNAKYVELQRQEDEMTTQLERESMSRGQYLAGVRQIQRDFRYERNTVAAEMTMLQAQSLAISGKQAAAQAAVDNAINIKYETKRLELDTRKFLLGIIADDLTAAEKKQWDVQQQILEREDAALEEQKDLEKTENKAKLDLIAKYSLVGMTIDSSLDEINMAVMGTKKYAQETRLADGGDGYAPTSDMKNYNAAVSQGYTGTFTEFIGVSTGAGGTYYDDNLLTHITSGASPNQAAQLVVEEQGENLTEKDKQKIYNRAQEIEKEYQEKKALEPEVIPEVSAIEKEITRLKGAGLLPINIRPILKRRYTQEEINASSVGSVVGKVGSFFSNLFGD